MQQTESNHTGDSRMVGGRYRRVWALVETIAAEPGLTRDDLAARYFLSERQTQADLNIIRHDMRLPLRRRQGYRFDGAHGIVPLTDALMLVAVLRDAMSAGSLPADGLHSLGARIPEMLPPHLRPLVSQLLIDARTVQPTRLQALADAMVRGQEISLKYATHAAFHYDKVSATILPELLLPIRGEWWVIGSGSIVHSRTIEPMLKVSRCSDITPVGAKSRTAAA